MAFNIKRLFLSIALSTLLIPGTIVATGPSEPLAANLYEKIASIPDLSNIKDLIDRDACLKEELRTASNVTYWIGNNTAVAQVRVNDPVGLAEIAVIHKEFLYHAATGIYTTDCFPEGKRQFIGSHLYLDQYLTGPEPVGIVKEHGVPKFIPGDGKHVAVIHPNLHFQGGVLHIVDGATGRPAVLNSTYRYWGGPGGPPASLDGHSFFTTKTDEQKDVTLFAPTNSSLAAAKAGLKARGKTADDAYVAHPPVLSTGLRHGLKLKSLGGDTIHITKTADGGFAANGAKIVYPDVLMQNGVAHLVDGALYK